jgi:predicted metal-binding membrane protein
MSARWFVVAGFVALAAIAWIFLWRSAEVMASMQGEGMLFDLMLAMMRPNAATSYLGATALMWTAMMVAMMTPAVLPVVLLFRKLDRGSPGDNARDTAIFGGAYLLVWSVYGLVMSLLQWGLHRGAVLEPHLLAAGPVLAGGVLFAAGLYQLTPFKLACLRHCRSPLAFLLAHWRSGALGALRMGAAHGLYCLGCCWALMLVMFAGGVMSVGLMVLLSAVILLERVLPSQGLAARLPAAVLLTAGGALLARML